MINPVKHPASFRDKSGYVFYRGKEIIRTVNYVYKDDFDLMLSSGLYQRLVRQNLIIKHQDISSKKQKFPGAHPYKLIKPKSIPFISYPYEWSYSQLLSAAKLTLEIEKIAVNHQMTLKDASAYNIQFIGTKPVFIDTLSFTGLVKDVPWVAYRQFCQHFLAPLILMKSRDLRLGKLSQIFLDGIDLDLAVKLIPPKIYLNFHLLLHLFLHSLGQKHFQDKSNHTSTKKFSVVNLQNLMDSLNSALDKLDRKKSKSVWSNYYGDNNYSVAAFDSKKAIVKNLLRQTKPKILADLGANTGIFSRLASNFSQYVISIDNDPQSIDENYRISQKENINNLLPLVADLVNPSPSIGWQNTERQDLIGRLSVDTMMVLALVHHLYFSHNLPFSLQAKFFASLTKNLLIEFIPVSDSQVKGMVKRRNEKFSDYSEMFFRKNFQRYFEIKKYLKIKDSQRSIYLLIKK